MDSGALRDSARGAVLSNCRFTGCLWLASTLKHDRGEDPVATVIVGRRGISLFNETRTRRTTVFCTRVTIFPLHSFIFHPILKRNLYKACCNIPRFTRERKRDGERETRETGFFHATVLDKYFSVMGEPRKIFHRLQLSNRCAR